MIIGFAHKIPLIEKKNLRETEFTFLTGDGIGVIVIITDYYAAI